MTLHPENTPCEYQPISSPDTIGGDMKDQYKEDFLNTIRGLPSRDRLRHAAMLIKNKNFAILLQCLQQGIVQLSDIEEKLYLLEDDVVLQHLLPHAKSEKQIMNIIKWIQEPTVLLQDSTENTINATNIEYLNALALARTNPMKCYTLLPLKTGNSNKFVVALSMEESVFMMGWGPMMDLPNHIDVFQNLTWELPSSDHKQFEDGSMPSYFRSGGLMTLNYDEKGNASVILNDFSTSYGHYDRRLLESKRDDILRALYASLGIENLRLDIEISEPKPYNPVQASSLKWL